MGKQTTIFEEIPYTFVEGAKPLVTNIPLAEFALFLEWSDQLSRDFNLPTVLYRCDDETLADVYGFAWTLYLSGMELKRIMADVRETS